MPRHKIWAWEALQEFRRHVLDLLAQSHTIDNYQVNLQTNDLQQVMEGANKKYAPVALSGEATPMLWTTTMSTFRDEQRGATTGRREAPT
jgi:hypothetical protein